MSECLLSETNGRWPLFVINSNGQRNESQFQCIFKEIVNIRCLSELTTCLADCLPGKKGCLFNSDVNAIGRSGDEFFNVSMRRQVALTQKPKADLSRNLLDCRRLTFQCEDTFE